MGFVLRVAVTFMVTVGNLAAALVYFRAGLPLIDIASQPQYQGPFSPVLDTAATIAPICLLMLELGVLLWLIYGSAQSERKQRVAVARGRRR